MVKWNNVNGLLSSKLKEDMQGHDISNSDSDISEDDVKTQKDFKTIPLYKQDTVQHVKKMQKIELESNANNIMGQPSYNRIYIIEDEFDEEKNQKKDTEIIVAENNFFNSKNNNEIGFGGVKELRPFDFPFVRRLLQRLPIETLSVDEVVQREEKYQKIEAVPRAYEEKYLREPIHDERPCVFGFNCQGMAITQANTKCFVLREFLLPSEEAEYEKKKQYPLEHRMCVMCKRNEIARALINVKADAMGVREDCIMQDYHNIVETDGEYCLSDCIVSNPTIYQGVIDPVVLHIRSLYRLEIKNGVKHYVQIGLRYPEDKRRPDCDFL